MPSVAMKTFPAMTSDAGERAMENASQVMMWASMSGRRHAGHGKTRGLGKA